MPKYRALRDNYGYKGGYWTAGQIIEIAENEEAPKFNFELVVEGAPVTPAPEVPKEPATFSEVNETVAKAEKPNVGFTRDPKKKSAKKK